MLVSRLNTNTPCIGYLKMKKDSLPFLTEIRAWSDGTRCLIGGITLMMALVSPKGFADSPAPMVDFIETTENGQYDFVMLPETHRKPEAFTYGGVKKDPALRDQYPASGLYLHGSKVPLWTVDWNAFGVVLSNDGHHVAQFGPWPIKDHYDELAIAFYEEGRLLKAWSVRDLVGNKGACLPQTVSHYRWLSHVNSRNDKQRLPGARDEVQIETYLQQSIRFDLTTGEIIESLPHIKDIACTPQASIPPPYQAPMDTTPYNPMVLEGHERNGSVLMILFIGIIGLLIHAHRSHRDPDD